MEYSNWIEAGCENENLTLSELAEEIGEDESQLEAWVEGEQTPSVSQINDLREVIGEPDSVSDEESEDTKKNGDPDIDFEDKLWTSANKLRKNLDAAVYKHVVLGLIFLKYISDSFEDRRQELEREKYADPEDPDEYRAEHVFWVPKEARWSTIQANAKQPDIGKRLNDAMDAIERENPSLKGVLYKRFTQAALDQHTLGELIDLISSIGLKDKQNQSRDILGRVYEYFLGQFADAEGKKGGQFYTPRPVVRLLVEMLAPEPHSRIYDPCCGSGGMFVQAERFIESHGGDSHDIAAYGQESNPTTWRLAKMNLAIRGIEGDLGGKHADSFHEDLHPDLKADYVLANPPFNMDEWGKERVKNDPRWKYGVPPANNANYAWIQHFIHHLAPNGTAGFVMANGSMSSQQTNEARIRKSLIEEDLVECIVALPGQLFYNTQIPVCLWFLTRNKESGDLRDRTGEILFIDARQMGKMISQTQRTLPDKDIKEIASTYHKWRGDEREVQEQSDYVDVKGYCKSSSYEEVSEHNFVLTPGRFVGIPDSKDEDDEPFPQKMERLTEALLGQFEKSKGLKKEIRETLKEIGYVE
jgi:type I restriction enzyme M protein